MDAEQKHREYTDAELDRDWVPNGRRPQSTIARSFSLELMDIFRIENSISDLDQQVDKRQQSISKGNEELASIEARLKEMENRLRSNGKTRPELGQLNLPVRDKEAPAPPEKDDKARSRPGTARAVQPAPSSGNMPPTPGASEDGDRE